MGFTLGYRIPSFLALGFACILHSFIWWLRDALYPVHSETSSSSEIPSSVSTAFAGLIRERLPVVTFRKFAERNCEVEENSVCAVCLSAFEEEDEMRELQNCCHVFHRDCLDKWVDHSCTTCPMCRSPLLGQQESEAGIDGELGGYLVDADFRTLL